MAKLHREFIWFAIAGAVGFGVDAGVLYAALALGCGPYVGRLISFLCAAFVTWQINRRITFTAAAGTSLWREWCQYLAAMSLGGACNYGAYVLTLHLLPRGPASPLLAVAAGSIAGMFVNFATAKLWVFRAAPKNEAK
ncbi:GtrA family protein [Paraburkholderia sp. HD33-4]|uniref:GtrA family protein n=1 Tax=Paraburkholderia sp. HD33-4 TaxID=2883242 RepID=UPI002DD42815|nr:GtrA family protein [Paraburkholderia sp. HD33-4]